MAQSQTLAGGAATITICPAGAATTLKTGAGTLFSVGITGTGTTGTVTIEDTGTNLFVASVPAAVVTYNLTFGPLGGKFSTGLKVTTSGTGVTAVATYI